MRNYPFVVANNPFSLSCPRLIRFTFATAHITKITFYYRCLYARALN